MTPEDLDPADHSADHMIALDKTKADLQELVRSLHRRNLTLQKIRDRYAHQIAHPRPPAAR